MRYYFFNLLEELAYDYPLYRPPSEANSTILQVTLGCSFNHCSFCSMYRTKFNNLSRISCYAMPKNLMQKKGSELERLRERGLSMLYVGIESGNDVVLQKVTKGASSSMIIESCNKALNHEFTLSCMIILGLGGRTYSDAHISDTATVMSQISPHYLAALNLQLDETVRGEFMSKFGEPFFWLTDLEILDELEKLTVLFDPARQVIFRANHASNVYSIGGSLPSERSKLQRLIHELKNHPEMLRPRIVRRF